MKFNAAIPGFHVYKSIWQPKENNLYEMGNMFDIFVIEISNQENGLIVQHFLLEISRFAKCLIDLGAIITTRLSKTHYRKSPILQGDLKALKAEIVKCTKTMKSLENTWKCCMHFTLTHFLDPSLDNEVIVGSFLTNIHGYEELFKVKIISKEK